MSRYEERFVCYIIPVLDSIMPDLMIEQREGEESYAPSIIIRRDERD
jgi:hypothetical protein